MRSSRRRLARLTVAMLASVISITGAAAQPAPLVPPVHPVRYEADFLPSDFHESRRRAVRDALPQGAVAVFFSAPVRNRQSDVNYEYRQDSDLYYLTGTHEPGSVLVLAKDGLEIDGNRVSELLMVPPRDPQREIWNGRRFGAERARTVLGVEYAVSNTRYQSVLAAILRHDDRTIFHLPLPDAVDPQSTLGTQIAFFRANVDHLQPIGTETDREMIRRILAVDNEEDFSLLKGFLRRNPLSPDTQTDSKIVSALEAFADSQSIGTWMDWKADNLGDSNAVMLRELLSALRSRKTKEELRLLQRAVDITAEAHLEAMRSIEPGMTEFEVEALIEFVFKRNGAEYPGFPSIVGSGENSIVLHYESNRRKMEMGDVVLMDIGAEYHGYTADLTRTVPVGGSFTPEQRRIYETVLAASEAAIDAARAGAPFWAPHRAASSVLARGLAELGLISRPSSTRELGRFFLHGTSHYLGLDVHDVGTYGELEPGNVITIEPGLYIAPADDIDAAWWNIGIRIEDDILITEGNPVVLSADLPRRPDEIEAIMQEQGLGNTDAGRLIDSE